MAALNQPTHERLAVARCLDAGGERGQGGGGALREEAVESRGVRPHTARVAVHHERVSRASSGALGGARDGAARGSAGGFAPLRPGAGGVVRRGVNLRAPIAFHEPLSRLQPGQVNAQHSPGIRAIERAKPGAQSPDRPVGPGR